VEAEVASVDLGPAIQSSTGLPSVSTEAVYSGPNKWRGMAAVGTKLYAVPDRANLLVLDLDSEDTDHVYGIDTDSVGTGNGKWHGIVAVGTKAYAPPSHADVQHMLVVDATTDTVYGVDTETIYSGPTKWTGITAVTTSFALIKNNHKCKEYGGHRIGSTITVGISTVQDCYDECLAQDGCKAFSVDTGNPWCQLCNSADDLAHEDHSTLHTHTIAAYRMPVSRIQSTKVYAAPGKATSVLVLDTATDAVYGVDTESIFSGDYYRWAGITSVGTKVYCPPNDATSVLVLDTTTDTVSDIDTESVHIGIKKWRDITTVGTKVYAPGYRAPNMLVVDTVTEVAYGVDTQHICTGNGKWRGIAALGTKVYAVPAGAPNVLVLDTVTDAVYGIDTEGVHGGPSRWNFAMSLGTKVYAVPYNAESVLVLDEGPSGDDGPLWKGVAAYGSKVYAVAHGQGTNGAFVVHDTASGATTVMDTSAVTESAESAYTSHPVRTEY
jgi:hypothetical protein